MTLLTSLSSITQNSKAKEWLQWHHLLVAWKWEAWLPEDSALLLEAWLLVEPQLLAVLQQFQKSAHLADAEKLIAEVDDDGSGDIDWQEFCKILQSTVANRPTAATMFDQLDTAGVGELTP